MRENIIMIIHIILANDISNLIGRRGRIIIIGCRGNIEINPRGLMGKTASVIGMALASCSQEEFDELFPAIQAGLENGTLSPVISPFSFTFDEASESHKHIIDRPAGTIGKVILKP